MKWANRKNGSVLSRKLREATRSTSHRAFSPQCILLARFAKAHSLWFNFSAFSTGKLAKAETNTL